MSTPTIDDRPLTDDDVAQQLAADHAAAEATAAPAPEPKPRRTRGQRATGRAKAPRKRATTTRTRAPRPAAEPVDYRKGADELVRLVGGGLALVAQQANAPQLQLDAMTITMAREPLAKGLADAATKVPLLASVLAWFATTSPLADLFGALGMVGAQLAANHGAIPAGVLGTMTPEQMATAWQMWVESQSAEAGHGA